MSPDIRKDALYDEPVNIDLEPDEALDILLNPQEESEEEEQE